MNLFAILSKLDERDMRAYESASEDDRKEIQKNAPWMLAQWLTGAKTEAQHREMVTRFDDRCNPGWASFYRHPELQVKLMAAVGTGKKIQHRFFKPGKRMTQREELEMLFRQEYPDARAEDLTLWCRDARRDDLDVLMNGYGIPMVDRKKIIEQFEAEKTKCLR